MMYEFCTALFDKVSCQLTFRSCETDGVCDNLGLGFQIFEVSGNAVGFSLNVGLETRNAV